VSKAFASKIIKMYLLTGLLLFTFIGFSCEYS
jgi:hypothetical protein